jgi:hypothetical protein
MHGDYSKEWLKCRVVKEVNEGYLVQPGLNSKELILVSKNNVIIN